MMFVKAIRTQKLKAQVDRKLPYRNGCLCKTLPQGDREGGRDKEGERDRVEKRDRQRQREGRDKERDRAGEREKAERGERKGAAVNLMGVL